MSKNFICSIESLSQPSCVGLAVTPLSVLGNRGTEQLRGWPKITVLVTSKGRIQT